MSHQGALDPTNVCSEGRAVKSATHGAVAIAGLGERAADLI